MAGKVRRIFLVRHGESMGNVDKDVHRTHADHAIPLSGLGAEQAVRAGEFLKGYFAENLDNLSNPNHPHRPRPRLWTSPYLRTRQTADGIERGIGRTGAMMAHPDFDEAVPQFPRIRDRRENIALCEQQFGLFDGIPDNELPVRFPAEHAHYKKQEDFEGRFWARMPMGESRWDVAIRVHQAFGTWHRDAERHGVEDLIVVTHGVTARCIVMRWLHLPFDWIEKEPNPKNCSVRLIEDGGDRGYIHKGG
jgi:2,3-bisphosphoglycerate-dependent phosphoglycerate mutase